MKRRTLYSPVYGKCVGLVLAQSAASLAHAAESTPPSFAPGLLQAVLGLAIVLALIWVAGWLMKKLAPGGLASNALIRTIATTAVGQRERIVLVEVQNTWLVVGVAPGSVNTLHVLPKGELPLTMSSASGSPFDKLLALAKQRRGGS